MPLVVYRASNAATEANPGLPVGIHFLDRKSPLAISYFFLNNEVHFFNCLYEKIKLRFQNRTYCIISDSDLHYTSKTNEALECVQRVTDRKWVYRAASGSAAQEINNVRDTMLLNNLIN